MFVRDRLVNEYTNAVYYNVPLYVIEAFYRAKQSHRGAAVSWERRPRRPSLPFWTMPLADTQLNVSWS